MEYQGGIKLENQNFIPDEIANIDKISKSTVELRAFKVGNRIRIEQSEVERINSNSTR